MELKAADTMPQATGSPTQTWANAGTERREGGADGEWRKEGTRAHEQPAKTTISSAAQPNANRSTTTRSSMCEMIHAWVGGEGRARRRNQIHSKSATPMSQLSVLVEDVYAHVGGCMELRAADTTRQARGSPTHVGERRHGTPRGWGGWRVEEGGNESTRTSCKAHHKQRSATKRQPQHHHPVVHPCAR